jgi:eukaryotic-like serine/threonine-protein kinase
MLSPGMRLGPYEIVSSLGAGGMGEVYRARDTRLDRTVAIKILPAHVGADGDSRARFEREARLLSSLHHPNICVLHDVGREGDVSFVVMQYLDGETLAARLARGPLPLGEALRYAIEIAGALDRAHRAGILHRDLKPGNIMLTRAARQESSATLLDFGLAKIIAPAADPAALSVAPTATSPLTGAGTIVGTLLYMSPEQLEGRDVDARSDIFSFGAVLYEMVAGRRAFEAGSQASIIGAILERDPAPLGDVAPLTPPALDRVVRKCLAKDRERRWQTAADLCDELTWIAQAPAVEPARALVPARSRRGMPLAAGVTMLLLGLAAAAWWFWPQQRADPPRTARHLSMALPDGLRLSPGGIAMAPDGESIVFVAAPPPAGGEPAGGSPAPRLYLRRLESMEVREIPGTEGARTPFFSPDGQTVGYLTNAALMKVSLQAGAPVHIAVVPPVSRGAVWLPDGSILVAPSHTQGLVRVSADGQSQPETNLDEAAGERAHSWPQLLPGGAEVLFTIRRGTAENADASDIALLTVATGTWRVILKGAAFGQYASTGHLLFVRAGTLSMMPFDLSSGEPSGTATALAEGLAVDPSTGGAHYAVAPDGTLFFLKGRFGAVERVAVWVDRAGTIVPAAGIAGASPGQPRISPNGARLLFHGISPAGDIEVYIADAGRGAGVRLTDELRDDFGAIWTHDGARVIWTALTSGRLPFLVMRAADGAGGGEPVTADATHAEFVGSVSVDGILAYTRTSDSGASDIWTTALDGERRPQPLVATAAAEFGPEFSPDGKWVAYISREGGTSDIYVVPYPGPGQKRRVTSGGAASPAWHGRELFYQTPKGLMVIDVTGDGAPDFGTPRLLFGGDFLIDSAEGR